MQRALSAIEAASKRGAALTSQLLTFARRQNVNPQAVDVTERINAVRDVLNTGVGGTVQLQFDIERSVWPVMVDVAELETALVNLVINARDAMPDGGTITVAAHNSTLSEEANAGEYVAISVSDTGTGIAPDVLSKIFDPFFTTKPIGKGTGLGLSQVHGFAHQAGGTVKVSSELGEGTTITILLPRKDSRLAVDDVESFETGGSGTVLLVEDNPDVAAVSTSLLEQLGYTVRRGDQRRSSLGRNRARRHRPGVLRYRDAGQNGRPRSGPPPQDHTAPAADPAGDRLQRRRGQCARRFSHPPQAL